VWKSLLLTHNQGFAFKPSWAHRSLPGSSTWRAFCISPSTSYPLPKNLHRSFSSRQVWVVIFIYGITSKMTISGRFLFLNKTPRYSEIPKTFHFGEGWSKASQIKFFFAFYPLRIWGKLTFGNPDKKLIIRRSLLLNLLG